LTSSPIEIWRGGVNPWECDEMGHLNVRFYARIASEGVAAFAGQLGLPNAFRPGAASTLAVRSHHIRFIREARNRAPLYMTARLVAIEETRARICFAIHHAADDAPCATFLTWVEHVDGDDRPLLLPVRDLPLSEIPDFARPRSVEDGRVTSTASLERAEALDLVTIGAGAITAKDADIHGRMEPEVVIGRVSDGVTRIVGPFRETVIEHAESQPTSVGGAVLEYRLDMIRTPRAGDRFVIRSGVGGCDSRGQFMIHWMLDPVSGQPWAVSKAYVITFDLDARKIIPIADKARDVILSRVPEGLAL
jgi:acyl-CoA thioester hydrolase